MWLVAGWTHATLSRNAVGRIRAHREVVQLFLKLGFIAFGGPAAHIALMRQEVVNRRKWLSEQAFLDLLGASNLIPGLTSTELAIYLEYTRAGPIGLLLAGGLFILPAMLLVLASPGRTSSSAARRKPARCCMASSP
jgi:chromate transporter